MRIGVGIAVALVLAVGAIAFFSWRNTGTTGESGKPNSETVAAKPQRIVVANTGAADILSRLVDLKRLAAVPEQVNLYAADGKFWLQHQDIPRFDKFQAEIILSFKPDLVVASAMQDSGAAAAIRGQKIPILYLRDFDSLKGIRESILTVGEAVGEAEPAKKLAAEFDARLAAVAKEIGDAKPVPTVIYSNFGIGYTVGEGTCQSDVLRAAGGLNMAAAAGMKGNVPLTFEQLLRMDPEWILVIGDNGLESAQAKVMLNEPALRELRAVKAKKIAVVPGRYFDALSQYAADAVEIVARQLHSKN